MAFQGTLEHNYARSEKEEDLLTRANKKARSGEPFHGRPLEDTLRWSVKKQDWLLSGIGC